LRLFSAVPQQHKRTAIDVLAALGEGSP
jgi:hypothetical protein